MVKNILTLTKPSGYKVTKKDLRNANWRWLMSVCTFNY